MITMKWLQQKEWVYNMKKNSDCRCAVKIYLICLTLVLIFAAQAAPAREIAGVAVPGSVTLQNKILVLNGAGIRKKLFFKIYVGALYLSARQTNSEQILSDPNAKRIVMSFLYKKVSVEDQVDAWNRGFAANSTAEELKNLQDRINRFNSLFPVVYKGDEIRLDYTPEGGTQVWVNETMKGSIPGEDFYRALLNIWIGPKPADEGLKDAWLGNTY